MRPVFLCPSSVFNLIYSSDASCGTSAILFGNMRKFSQVPAFLGMAESGEERLLECLNSWDPDLLLLLGIKIKPRTPLHRTAIQGIFMSFVAPDRSDTRLVYLARGN